MNYLAFLLVVLILAAFLPGSPYKAKPEVDWDSPHAWLSIARSVAVIALVIAVLAR